MSRLSLRRLARDDLAAFHRLATDAHVRRFLLDGAVVVLDWARAEIERSDALFAAIGLGLWLVLDGETPVGFAGFRVFEELSPEPQLVYALLERATGRGHATAVAGELVGIARPVLGGILAAADEPNAASIRVLEKLRFRPAGSVPGAFGRTLLFRLDA